MAAPKPSTYISETGNSSLKRRNVMKTVDSKDKAVLPHNSKNMVVPPHNSKDMVVPPHNSNDWVVCPYSSNHHVQKDKMWDHLDKCRSMYIEKKEEKGDWIPYLSCQYNSEHEIIAPELYYHEARCEDAENEVALAYQLKYGLELAKLMGKEIPDWINPEEIEPDEEELQRMYGPLVDTFVGAAYYGRKIPFSQVGKIEYIMPLKECLWIPNSDEAKAVPTQDAEEEGAVGGSATETPTASNVVDDPDDEEYWAPNPNRPAFDYVSNFATLTVAIDKYPPYVLTRKQKREFNEWNGLLREKQRLMLLREREEAEKRKKEEEEGEEEMEEDTEEEDEKEEDAEEEDEEDEEEDEDDEVKDDEEEAEDDDEDEAEDDDDEEEDEEEEEEEDGDAAMNENSNAGN